MNHIGAILSVTVALLIVSGFIFFLIRHFILIKCPYCSSRKTKINSSEPDMSVGQLNGIKRLKLHVHCNKCKQDSGFIRIGMWTPDGYNWLPAEHLK